MKEQESNLIILGNQAADLDSTVCTLSLADLLYCSENKTTIPLLRGDSDDLRLKPEIPALLEYAGIEKNKLVFHFTPNPGDRYFLVDHNSPEDSMPPLPLLGIIDHHLDSGYAPDLAVRVVEPCGSCASLVCREWFIRNRVPDRKNALLLAAAIVVDTGNFDPQWGKTTNTDLIQFDRLKKLLNRRDLDFLRTLPEIKNDLHTLGTGDHLKRDYKNFRTAKLKGGISTVPLSIQDFFASRLYNHREVEDFIRRENLDLLFIMHTLRNPFGRELSFTVNPCSPVNRELQIRLINALSGLPDISLTPATTFLQSDPDWLHFCQGNSKASRKVLLPLIKGIIEDICPEL